MNKHTPGPWVWTSDDQLVAPSAQTAWGAPERIVETDSGFYPPFGADRALIAAAPELLEALKTLVVFLPSDHPEFPDQERIQPSFVFVRWADLRQARAAIAKATGEV